MALGRGCLWLRKSIVDMSGKSDVLCIVCSAGGHLTEAQLALEGVDYPKFLVTYRMPHFRQKLPFEDYYFITNPHKNPSKYLANFVQSLRIYIRQRPKFILSTGSGMAIATCLIGKLCGSRIIYIETGARIYNPSLTAQLMYLFADLFIVQWEQLLKHFPTAVYGGLLI